MKYRNSEYNEKRNRILKGAGVVSACLMVILTCSLLVSAEEAVTAGAAVCAAAAAVIISCGAYIRTKRAEKEYSA